MAVGDSATAVLAALAFVALRREWPAARRLAWACTAVGALDLAVALPRAAAVGASAHLAAQWYVPVLVVLVSHVGCVILLLRGARP